MARPSARSWKGSMFFGRISVGTNPLMSNGMPIRIIGLDRSARTVEIVVHMNGKDVGAPRILANLADWEIREIEKHQHPKFGPADVVEKTTEIKEAS